MLNPTFELYQDSYSATIDLANIPKDAVTVTVNVKDTDEKLKKIIERRISSYRESRDKYAAKKYYALAGKLDVKVAALTEVLDEFND